MQCRSIVLIITWALLAGCAATVKREASGAAMMPLPASASSKLVLNVGGSNSSVTSGDWEGFKLEWRENFTEQSKIAGVPFEMQEGSPTPTGQDGTLLFVFVSDYRFVRPGTRYVTGIMSGNAYIQSKLSFSNLKTGESYGSIEVNTSSSAWQGVFSAMTNKQVEAIAVDVYKDLKNGKK